MAATVTSTGLIAQQVAGKAVRDALFLSTFQAHHLPHAMALGAALSLIAAAAMPRVAARVAPGRIVPLLFTINAVGFGLDWLLLKWSDHAGSLAVYLQTTLIAPLVMATFWSLVNERFDPHTAKRAVARIAAGGTLGGVLGGLLTWRAASLVNLEAAVFLLAGINLVCLLGSVVIRSPARPAAAREEAPPAGLSPLSVLRKSSVLRNLALLVGVGAILSALLDYVFSVQAVTYFGRGPQLLAFFSLFGLAVSVLSLGLQLGLGRVAMEKLGLTVNIGVLPGIIVFGGAAGLAVPGLVSATLLRGAEMIQRNTLFKSAYELLYTPLPELEKRTTKALIDVGCDRLGTLIGSLLTMLAVYTVARSQSALLGLTLVLAFATIPIVRRLHLGYIAALEQRLREGEERTAREDEVVGNAPSSVDGERACEVLHQVAKDQVAKDQVAALDDAPRSGLAKAVLARPEELIAATGDLLGGDRKRARAALRRLDARTRPLAGHAILLLADKELHLEARETLRRIAPAVVGQLVDSMVDTEMDTVVRRRIPPVLAIAPSQRAADGLLLALADPSFEVRYAAGRALYRMTEGETSIRLAEEQITAVILAEVKREQEIAHGIDDEHLSGEATAPFDVMIRDRVSRGLEHLFTILALLLDREGVRVAFRALHQDDARYRGTALEYLQTVLPGDLRDVIWPLISGESRPLPRPRLPNEVLADLARVVRLERGKAASGSTAEDARRPAGPRSAPRPAFSS